MDVGVMIEPTPIFRRRRPATRRSAPAPVGAASWSSRPSRLRRWSPDPAQLVMTDPNTDWTFEPPTPHALWRFGSLSPLSRHYVAVSGTHIADGTVGGPSFDAFVSYQIRDARWPATK